MIIQSTTFKIYINDDNELLTIGYFFSKAFITLLCKTDRIYFYFQNNY